MLTSLQFEFAKVLLLELSTAPSYCWNKLQTCRLLNKNKSLKRLYNASELTLKYASPGYTWAKVDIDDSETFVAVSFILAHDKISFFPLLNPSPTGITN